MKYKHNRMHAHAHKSQAWKCTVIYSQFTHERGLLHATSSVWCLHNILRKIACNIISSTLLQIVCFCLFSLPCNRNCTADRKTPRQRFWWISQYISALTFATVHVQPSQNLCIWCRKNYWTWHCFSLMQLSVQVVGLQADVYSCLYFFFFFLTMVTTCTSSPPAGWRLSRSPTCLHC